MYMYMYKILCMYVYIYPDFQQGCPVYFDITIQNSLLSSYISMSARETGAAALAGQSEKDNRHWEAVERTGCMFFPLAIETLGVWSPNSLETLKIIARRTILSTGKTVSNLGHQQSAPATFCSLMAV